MTRSIIPISDGLNQSRMTRLTGNNPVGQRGKNMKNYCIWSQEEEGCFDFVTSCNQDFQFYEGTPKENEFKFCPFCGKEIEEELIEEED